MQLFEAFCYGFQLYHAFSFLGWFICLSIIWKFELFELFLLITNLVFIVCEINAVMFHIILIFYL